MFDSTGVVLVLFNEMGDQAQTLCCQLANVSHVFRFFSIVEPSLALTLFNWRWLKQNLFPSRDVYLWVADCK